MSARTSGGGSNRSCTPSRPRAAEIEYVRLYTGFCRRITVTRPTWSG